MIKHVKGKYRITVKYNGSMFPRTINLPKHQVISFLKDRLEITFDDFDAYSVLKRNRLLNAHTSLWEFEIVKVEEKKGDFLVGPKEDAAPEVKKSEPKPKASRPKKVKRIAK